MADAKISALPRGSIATSDIIPFTIVSTSITSGISGAELYNVGNQNLTVSGAGSVLGYAAGAGGTVTQSIGGRKEISVALNRATGIIIWSNSVMAASTITSTLFGNSVIGINDTIVLNYIGNGLGTTNMRSYALSASVVSPGAALINIKSNNNFADASSIFANFAVIKGAIT